MRIRKIITSTISILFILCLAIMVFESRTRAISRLYDNFVLDNRSHYLSCDQLPAYSTVKQVMVEKRVVIQQIEQVNPGLVGVEIDSTKCPGKADVLIWYASHQDRLAIEKIIANDTFFGVLYRLENR